MKTEILGNIRQLNTQYFAEGTDEQAQFNWRGEQVMALGLPERTELVRLGYSWAHTTPAVACVAALPTTAAAATIWNGESANGRSYVIDRIIWTCTTSAAAASMFSMAIQLNRTLLTAAPATIGSVVASSLQGKVYGGKAVASTSVTLGADHGWWPVGQPFNASLTATVGAQLDVFLGGLVIVPPNGLFCMTMVAVNTTAAGKFTVVLHEILMPIAS